MHATVNATSSLLILLCTRSTTDQQFALSAATMWKPVDDAPNTACGACIGFGLGFQCGICYEPCRPVSMPCCKAYNPPATRPHGFCAPCFGKYVSLKIEEGVTEIACPEPGCDNAIGDKTRNMLNTKGFLREGDLQRLKELKNVDRIGRLRDIFLGTEPGLYDALINTTQSCPHCYTITQRSDGCSHMTCPCGGEYCWVCGEAYPLAANHTVNHAVSHARNNGRGPAPRLNPQGVASALEIADARLREAADTAGGAVPVRPEELEPLLQRAEAESAAMTEGAARAAATLSKEGARSRLMDDILQLRCPNVNCRHAVVMDEDFDSCFSLQCARCSSHFCAWCFRLSPSDADPHGHVIDCPHAPAEMLGSALYLHDHNGGPHVPPNPFNKFTQHWTATLRGRAQSFLRGAAIREAPASSDGAASSSASASTPAEPSSVSTDGTSESQLTGQDVRELLDEVREWSMGQRALVPRS